MSTRTDDQAEEALLDPESSQDEYSRPALQRINTADDDYISDSEHSRIRKLLYVSHFLSTWNSRVFEFAAFLFLANIYPQTLLPASVYALARAGSAAIVSPWLGPYIDTANRLKVVRISIGKPSHLERSWHGLTSHRSWSAARSCSFLRGTVSHGRIRCSAREKAVCKCFSRRAFCARMRREAQFRPKHYLRGEGLGGHRSCWP